MKVYFTLVDYSDCSRKYFSLTEKKINKKLIWEKKNIYFVASKQFFLFFKILVFKKRFWSHLCNRFKLFLYMLNVELPENNNNNKTSPLRPESFNQACYYDWGNGQQLDHFSVIIRQVKNPEIKMRLLKSDQDPQKYYYGPKIPQN